MAADLEIYHDDETVQLSNTSETIFLTNKTPVSVALTSYVYRGAHACLQTDSAYLTNGKFGDAPIVKNYSDNSVYFFMAYKPDESLVTEMYGIELFNQYGIRVYHSSYRVMRILDVVSGQTSTSSGMIVNKNYNKPIAVLVGHVPTLTKAIRVVANANGLFQVFMETGTTHEGSRNDLTYSEKLHEFKPNPFQFIIIDVSNY